MLQETISNYLASAKTTDATPAGANNGRGLSITDPSNQVAQRILFLKPEEIDHVEAAGNYVVLHAGKERHILRKTTAAMETQVAPAGFMRINRSTIVNLACIREIRAGDPKDAPRGGVSLSSPNRRA